MKQLIVFNVFLIISCVFGELPPPYSGRGFRPSPPLLFPSKFQQQVKLPQTQYGPPDRQQTQFSSQKLPERPQSQYGIPEINSQKFPQNTYGPPDFDRQKLPVSPQIQYSAPDLDRQKLPQSFYGSPLKETPESDRQQFPQTTYGPPNRPDLDRQKLPQRPLYTKTQTQQSWIPYIDRQRTPYQQQQNIFNIAQYSDREKHPVNLLQSNYGPPESPGIESLDQQELPYSRPANFKPLNRFQNTNFQNNRLPQRQFENANEQFRLKLSPQSQRSLENENKPNPLSVQYLPVFNAADFKKGINYDNKEIIPEIDVRRLQKSVEIQQANVRRLNKYINNENTDTNITDNDKVEMKYLPPTTTERIYVPRPTRRPPQIDVKPTTPRPTEETTTASNDNSGRGPNISIATAFAGRLYLLQPDGSFQMVNVSPKERDGKSDLKIETADNGMSQQPIYQLSNYQTLPLHSLFVPLYTFA